jgi:uncharacterized protein (DUF305 family)
MLKSRPLLLVAAVAATALALSGCAPGNGGMSSMDNASDGPTASGSQVAADFNDADVAFAEMMIPHHEQAVEMSDMLLAKDGIDQRVAELAGQIKDAQQPEIDQLRDWLIDWGREEADMGGMNHGGMMSEADMTALENAEGAEAARLFLEQMTEHHEGAIAMAEAEVDDGRNEDAKAMAATIVTTQTEEIATMQQLLASL